MARKGPIVTDSSTVALGLAQVRIGASAANIANNQVCLAAADSIGGLANTRFIGNTDWYKLESGFPLIEDWTTPIREAAALEVSFKEITPANMALAYGLDPNAVPYSAMAVHSGEIPLGGRVEPAFVRMEAMYTYPDGTHFMDIIFPRAQVSSTVEIELNAEDAAAVPITIEAKAADSNVSGGHVVWDNAPLGRIAWR